MGLLHRLPRLQFCCCCIELRTGAIILGVLGVLCYIGSTVNTSTLVAHPESIEKVLRDKGVKPEDMDKMMSKVKPILIYSLINSLISLLISLLLLVGAVKRNAKMLAIYLYINLVAIGLVIIFLIMALIIVPIFAVILGISLAIALYYLFCINSYYLLLEEEQNHPDFATV